MYLFLTTDAFSRKIVGWQLADSMEAKWAVKTLQMSLKDCKDPAGIIHHSDRGFQYCSKAFRKMAKKNNIIMSMGKAGYCYDNAKAERVNGILKTEYYLDMKFKSQAEALKAVRQTIRSYNEQRPHIALGMKRPNEVHKVA